MLLGPAGYIAAATGFLTLILLLLTTIKQKSLQKWFLILSCSLGLGWSVITSIQLIYQLSILSSLLAESLFNLVVCLLVISTLSGKQTVREIFTERVQLYLCLVIGSVALIDFVRMMTPFLSQKIIFLNHLGLAVIGLWFVEQLYRRSHRTELWAIKPLCIGVGLIHGYNFALYSDAILTNAISSPFWLGRGWILLASTPLILLTARRMKNWASRVYVSREIIYHSTLMMVAGGYLMIMAIVGFQIKSMGMGWSSTIQIVFFALSGVVLASLFLSDTFRNKIKVFISKHFFANKYEYRQEWMKFSAELENNAQSPYENALTAMSRPFGSEHAILVIQKNGKLLPQSGYNIEITHPEAIMLSEQFANKAIEHQWIVDIHKLVAGVEKPPFSYDPQLLCNIRKFSHIIPLGNQSGVRGVFLLSKPTSTDNINWEDRDLMNAISKQLSVYLNVFETNKKLAESQQFDTFNRMSAFLVHDLKNVVAQLDLLSKNAKKHRSNPEFIDDAFETVDSASQRLNKVLSQLSKKRIEADSQQHFQIDDVLTQVCQLRSVNTPAPEFICSEGGQGFYLLASKERFHNILSHLIQNAQDATKEDGYVRVSLDRHNQYYKLVVRDSGEGMSQDFIDNRLFKPFDTTKGNAGMGIGAYDAKAMVEQMGGYVEVKSAPNAGTLFILYIPIPQKSPLYSKNHHIKE